MQINYNLYMNCSGYAISAMDYILAMLNTDPNLDIRINCLNQTDWRGISPNRMQIFKALQSKKNAPNQISLYHSIPYLYNRPPKSDCHIGFSIFETINPPKEWVKRMNTMDGIITATSFNKNIFEKSGTRKPIYSVPHCFDTKLFNEEVKAEGRFGKTTFISIGTWKRRKNWESLIKAFYDGFEMKDNVCLLIKTDNPQLLKSTVASIKKNGPWRTKQTAPVYTEESTHVNFEDIPKIMKKGDIYVNASLSEGFSLPSLHAMALGIPLITTRFGGVLEFAHPQFCTYIEPKGYQTIMDMDGIPQFKNCIWPVIRVSDIRDAMRNVWSNFSREKIKASQAYEYVHNTYSYKQIGPQMINAINSIKDCL